MRFDRELAKGESEAAPSPRRVGMALELEIPIENLVAQSFRDAAPLVRDADLHVCLEQAGRKHHAAFVRGISKRVVDEILEHTADQIGIRRDAVGGYLSDELHVLALSSELEWFEHLTGEHTQVDALAARSEL